MNQKNCATCDHKQRPDGGHCYMFRQEPVGFCGQHTALQSALKDIQRALLAQAAKRNLRIVSWS